MSGSDVETPVSARAKFDAVKSLAIMGDDKSDNSKAVSFESRASQLRNRKVEERNREQESKDSQYRESKQRLDAFFQAEARKKELESSMMSRDSLNVTLNSN